MFSKNKINKLLIIGFVGNITMLVLILVIILFEIDIIKTNYAENYKDFEASLYRLDMVNVLYVAELKLNSWHKLTKNHILSKDAKEMDTIEDTIKDRKEEIDQEIKEYKSYGMLKDNSNSLVEDFEDKVKQFEKINKKVLGLSKSNMKTEAYFLSKINSKEAFIKAEDALNVIIYKHIEGSIIEKKENLAVYNKSLQVFSFTIKFIIILGIITCVVSFVLAIVSINLIRKHYNKVKENELVLREQNEELVKQEKELQEKNTLLIKKSEEFESANRELIIINKSLRELDSMKSNFISTVSHELRTPLTSIKGSLGLILNDVVGSIDGESKKFLNISYRNTDRLIRLINELLDISKIESGNIMLNKEEFNLIETIRESIEGICPFAVEKKVKIHTNIEQNLRVYADRDRIEQILYNLLSNAIKFSAGNGGRQGEISISAFAKDDFINVCIKDNGIGIPEDKLEQIFEKFTQVDNTSTRDKEGTGLGLAICKALVEEHRGVIWVESKPGEGAKFSFSIASKETQINYEQLSKSIS